MQISRRWVLSGSAASLGLAVSGCGGGSSGDDGAVAVVTASNAAAIKSTPVVTPTPTPTATVAARNAVLVQAGDSIGVGYPGTYAAIDHLDFGSGVSVHNDSVSGRTLASIYAARDAELFAYADPARTCVLLIEAGTNDLGGGTASAVDLYGTASAFVAAAHAAGFYVALDVLLPRNDVGGSWTDAKEAQRRAYNAMVRANTAGADLVIDLAADPLLGDAVDPATSAYFADGLHPNTLGQERLVVIYQALLPALLDRVPRGRS